MSEWITWLIQVVAYGLVCFLFKRELHQMDERNKRQDDRIDTMEEKMEGLVADMPFKFTMRDDFIRAVASFDNKLDKILDQLNRKN